MKSHCDTFINPLRLIENVCWKTRGKKKVHCHLEVIYKTTLCLVTKLFSKHVNILQTTKVRFTFSISLGQPGETMLVTTTQPLKRKDLVCTANLLSR